MLSEQYVNGSSDGGAPPELSLLSQVKGSSLHYERTQHVCREGDTLQSVAANHPGLRNIRLWKLLAQLNKISTEVDVNGAPVSDVRTGQILVLPLLAEVIAYNLEQTAAKHAL